jgi:small subunit ribosomal protein S17e
VRRLAEELVTRYPTLFGADFDKNKQALSQVSIIRTRSVRNQLAGAITKIMHEKEPAPEEKESDSGPTLEERVQLEGNTASATGASTSSGDSDREPSSSSESLESANGSMQKSAPILG